MMFDQTFVNTQAQTRRPWTVVASVLMQTALVAALLIAPLLHIAKLEPAPKLPIWMPVQKLDLAVKPEVKVAPHTSSAVVRPEFHSPVLTAPIAIPRIVDMAPDAPPIVSTVAAATGGPVGIPFSELTGGGIPAPPTPTPKPAPQPQAARPSVPVPVGGDVQAAKLIFSPKPQYPPLAKAARLQGTVRIQATISREGLIENLRLIGGPPLLVNAALDAVRQWRYKATTLNGQAVEVITEIAVNFTLSQ